MAEDKRPTGRRGEVYSGPLTEVLTISLRENQKALIVEASTLCECSISEWAREVLVRAAEAIVGERKEK